MKPTSRSVYHLVLAAACGVAGLLLGACRTANGFGQDIKNTGNSIQRAANR